MKPGSVAVVGAAETTELGRIPTLTVDQLHCDAAINAMNDAGLKPKDIDGVATAGSSPNVLARMLGIVPTYIDGTGVGGCSFMLHVRHAAAAINEGLCTTVLITHGESGKSRVGAGGGGMGGGGPSWAGQFEAPYGGMGPPTSFTIPWLRYAKTYGATAEDLARVAVIQREWAGLNPRASYRDPLTMDDVLNAEMIAYPFTKLMCCLVTDGGGALILTSADRAKDFPQKPVYILGTGESVETPMVSQMDDMTTSRAFKVSADKAWKESGLKHSDIDHLMIYDAFAHLPLYGLEDLGFVKKGEAKDFIKAGHTKIGGKLPLNTNGGGLSYMHSGMYGMYAMQESVRQLRGIAPAQVKGAKTSFCQGVGGMFAAAGTIIFGNERP
jgi:acetyl-CoA acetyltransferase